MVEKFDPEFIKRIEKDIRLLKAARKKHFFCNPVKLSYFVFETDPITLRISIPLEFVEDLFDYIKYLKTKKND